MERERASSRDYDRGERDRERERTRDRERDREYSRGSGRERGTYDKDRDKGRDRESSTSPKTRARERERDRERHREREIRDREKDRDRDRDRDRERDPRDRERDRDSYDRPRDREQRDPRDRDRDRERERERERGDRERDPHDRPAIGNVSVAFSRPATYDPRLAQRTQLRNQRTNGYDDGDDSRYEDTMRRKQLKDELGLSDDDQEPPGDGGSDDDSSHMSKATPSGAARAGGNANNREMLEQLEKLEKEIQTARENEQKAQDSLSKLQLLSKSQTAILKTTMAKKIQEKEDLLEEMAGAIKDLEAKLQTAGIEYEAYTAPLVTASSSSSGGRASSSSSSEADAIAEIGAMKSEIDRLVDENKGLKATAASSASTKPVSPSQRESSPQKEGQVNKAKLEAVEAEKRTLAQQLKETQQKLAALEAAAPPVSLQSSVPAPPVPFSDGLPSNAEELRALQKKIQRLEKELALSQQAATLSSSDAAKASAAAAAEAAKEAAKTEAGLQARIKQLESEIEVTKAKMEQQTKSLQVKETAWEEKHAKLKAAAEGELTKIKEQAKKAILDLKKRLESTSKDHQQKRKALGELHVQLQKQKTDLTTLKSQITNQNQQFPAMAKQLTDKITQRIQKQTDAMAGVVENYKREIKERKRLFNLVQELKGNIRVLCRVRPISKSEINSGSKMICKFTNEEITLAGEKGKMKTWEFDRVFDMNSTQDQLFSEVRPLVTSILDGYSVCIFAYGQTGSGKTHTMAGPPESPGINTRSLQELFERKSQRFKEYQDEITVSVMEIYNEQIRDLLAQDAANTNLQVRQGPTGNFVPGLTVVPVQTLDEVFELIKRGNKNRSTHATDMNEHSSRSHSILSIQMKSMNLVTNAVSNGKLFLVDLAGSERLSKTGAEGQRLKEAQNINKSLSALGDVIAARASKAKHVPYRNSSLTYLLQDALGGDSKTLMVACASPVDYNSEESFCTLNFAARTRSVEMGKATKNVSQAKE